MVKYLFWKLYLSYLCFNCTPKSLYPFLHFQTVWIFFVCCRWWQFFLWLYVFNGLNEIKIILKEGVVYLFYTQNTHKWRNKNSQYFLAPMASKVNKQTWNKQKKERKFIMSTIKPNYLKETYILSFYFYLLIL